MRSFERVDQPPGQPHDHDALVLPLVQLDRSLLPLVGGKAAQLGKPIETEQPGPVVDVLAQQLLTAQPDRLARHEGDPRHPGQLDPDLDRYNRGGYQRKRRCHVRL